MLSVNSKGQPHGKGAAHTRLALHTYVPAIGLGQSPDNGQPNPGSLLFHLATINLAKSIKDPGECFLADADATIGNLQHPKTPISPGGRRYRPSLAL